MLFAEIQQVYKQQTSSGGALGESTEKAQCSHQCWGLSRGGRGGGSRVSEAVARCRVQEPSSGGHD